jgi:hypothetical protein
MDELALIFDHNPIARMGMGKQPHLTTSKACQDKELWLKAVTSRAGTA